MSLQPFKRLTFALPFEDGISLNTIECHHRASLEMRRVLVYVKSPNILFRIQIIEMTQSHLDTPTQYHCRPLSSDRRQIDRKSKQHVPELLHESWVRMYRFQLTSLNIIAQCLYCILVALAAFSQ